MKRIIAICFTIIMILNTMPMIVFGAEYDNVLLYSEDFSNGMSLGVAGTFETAEKDAEHGTSLMFNQTDAPLRVGIFDKTLADGRYHMSFEAYCDDYSDIQVYLCTQADTGVRTASSFLLYFKPDGNLEVHRNGSWMVDRSLFTKYTPEKWYTIDMWIDTENREISVCVDGEEKALIEAPDAMTDFCGFAVRCGQGETPIYLDNFKLLKENPSNCDGFSKVYVKADAGAGIIGNNFYTDRVPLFNVTIKNRLNRAIDGRVYHRASVADDDYYKNYEEAPKSENKIVWQSRAEELSLNAGESAVRRVEIDKIYYGRMKLETVVEINGNEYVTETPYTMSRRTEGMPVNKAVGVHSQNAEAGNGKTDRKGGYKYTVPVLARAGFGTYRNGNILSWREAELTKGVLKFTDDMKTYIDFLDKYDMDLIYLYGNTSQFYSDEEYNESWHPMSNQECLDAMVKYIGGLTEFADGKLKAIEVWNEWFGSNNSLNEFNYDLFAKMHRLIYDEVNSKSDTVDVIGLNADWWCTIRDDNTENALKAMQSGGYLPCMDGISVHPYNPERNRPEYTWRTYYGATVKDISTTKIIDDKLDSMLDKYGQTSYMPRIATEAGWGDYNTGYDRGKQAAYTVRLFALSQAERSADTMCIHVDVQYADKINSTEAELIDATMGILESGTKDGTEIPYLGKPAYVATAYYNTLATDNKGVEKLELGENIYAYNITMSNGKQALMLGCIEGDETDISIKLPENTISVADMYGNEKSYYSENGVYKLKISEEPIYLIGKDLTEAEMTAETQSKEYTYAVIGGYAKNPTQDKNVCIDVYNQGYLIEDINEANIKDALYFRGQCTADVSGHFEFAFPVLLEDGEEKNVYVRCEGEDVQKYVLYKSGNALYCVKEQSDVNGRRIMIDASAWIDSVEMPKFVCAVYEDNVLKNVRIPELEYENGGYMFFNTDIKANDDEIVKLFYFKDAVNIVPLGSAVSIY